MSETTLRFLPDGEMVALVRPGYIGTSRPPYREWSFCEMADRIGGTELHPAAGRQSVGERQALHGGRASHGAGSDDDLNVRTGMLTLPSGGDTSYAGMVWHDDLLWMSYYSSHEKGTNVYLARVGF